jgi:uncharacterized integral membrane protein
MNFRKLIFQRILFALIFNTTLFLILLIGIQNSSKKNNINFFFTETINLPISFIIGTSFLTGSISGSLISLFYLKKEK